MTRARNRIIEAHTAGTRLGRAAALLLAFGLAGCGDFIEYERPRSPASDAEPDVDPSDAGATGPRAFYATCADRLAAPGSVDDAGYAELLLRRVQVDGAGFALVDYAGWRADDDDVASLEGYLQALAAASPRECDLALWLNAYNANVLRAVLDASDGNPAYSVSQDDFAFFKVARHPVAGLSLTLDELEHGVVRGDFRHGSVVGSPALDSLMAAHARLWNGETVDARIHMALNCAARGCPNLAPEPFAGAQLDAQLERAVRGFLENADKGAGPDGVTQLFDWFQPDFEADSGSVEAFIRRHRDGGLGGVNAGAFIPYDWSLNSQ